MVLAELLAAELLGRMQRERLAANLSLPLALSEADLLAGRWGNATPKFLLKSRLICIFAGDVDDRHHQPQALPTQLCSATD